MEVQIGEDDFSFEYGFFICFFFVWGGGQGLMCSSMLNFKSVVVH